MPSFASVSSAFGNPTREGSELMQRSASTIACAFAALALFAATPDLVRSEPLQSQVSRDGLVLDLPDGFKAIPYMSPRGRLLVEPAVPAGAPLNTIQTPFVRSGSGDPIIFSGITTTAKQFAITKPADATSYRFVNPCNVDVRIRKVASMTESVTQTTGTRFMARSVEVLGSSQPTFVSLIATAAPTGECAPELQYGRGS